MKTPVQEIHTHEATDIQNLFRFRGDTLESIRTLKPMDAVDTADQLEHLPVPRTVPTYLPQCSHVPPSPRPQRALVFNALGVPSYGSEPPYGELLADDPAAEPSSPITPITPSSPMTPATPSSLMTPVTPHVANTPIFPFAPHDPSTPIGPPVSLQEKSKGSVKRRGSVRSTLMILLDPY